MFRNLILSASLLALAACSVGPDYAPPALAAPAPGFATQTPSVSAELAAERWWTLYGDPVLDKLVDDALAHNTDLREAVANVAIARAGLREVGADRLPQTAISAGADYGRQPASQRRRGGTARTGTCRAASASPTRSTCSAASAAASRPRAATSAGPRALPTPCVSR